MAKKAVPSSIDPLKPPTPDNPELTAAIDWLPAEIIDLPKQSNEAAAAPDKSNTTTTGTRNKAPAKSNKKMGHHKSSLPPGRRLLAHRDRPAEDWRGRGSGKLSCSRAVSEHRPEETRTQTINCKY